MAKATENEMINSITELVQKLDLMMYNYSENKYSQDKLIEELKSKGTEDVFIDAVANYSDSIKMGS